MVAPVARPAMVTEFSLGMENGFATLHTRLDQLGSTEYAKVLILEHVRKITAFRAQSV